jgi:hypothetical protein
MEKKKKKVVLIIILTLLMCLDSVVFAQDDEDTRCTLRGLKEIFLYVEPLDPEVEKMGLTRDQIQADTGLRLKLAGIHVQAGEEFIKVKGHPYLYVNLNISILKTQITRYLFYIRVELNQEVALVRTPDTKTSAATWSTGGWGIDFSLDNIRQTVKTQVDKFISAFLAENPK